ncbi:hypothetical protein [Mangrovitalea sediminis]|uniref:hypothetical protein n=1 Tax=Mangrovitalea sediminis TaxID=1982043 RepID=UPI000BE56970|nr:hypothetical protein [Mangrovitalea sediminis]
MSSKAGVWIDHRKAVVVTLGEDKETVQTLLSEAEKPSRSSGGSHQAEPFGHQDVVAGDRRDHVYRQQLERFYAQVADCLKTADAYYIFGAGEAHKEFHHYLRDQAKLGDRVREVSAADKLSDQDIVAEVRRYFHRS